ncbi:MAG: universal stress protein [Caldimicrobium sp.]|nr:universal stress protein [Caldimicrobium sp.]MCX7613904.1 universal stress protein [Caldimicrobium sp.]MDW8183454.1 universal stress protein [Caldimicrobium sp.]
MQVDLKVCKIILATDGSEFSLGAEEVALNLAKLCQAKLIITHVLYYNPEYLSIAADEVDVQKAKAKEVIERVKEEALQNEIEVDTKVVLAEAIEDGVITAAEEEKADLIVMGRRGIRGLSRHFIGSATLGVIDKAPCPVLIVPKNALFKGKAILAAIDGSDPAQRALILAYQMAKRINLPVYVLSVAKNIHEKAKAEEVLNKALELAENFELKPKTTVHFGPAERIILEVAKQREADFIVMGKRGLKGLSKLLLGSVSEKVVASADRGVIIVR